MNTAPTPSVWNETYSTKHIPIQVCASPSLFVNMNPTGNDPLTSMTQSIRNKNKYAAKLKSQSDDPSLTWEDTYSDPTNCSPCYVNACPTPKITVNTANGGSIGPNDNITTTGTIICGELFVTTDLGKNGIFLKPVNNKPTLTLINEPNDAASNACSLSTTSIVMNNTDLNTGITDTAINISGVDGTISMGGYIQVGTNPKYIPTNKNMGYCVTSFTNKQDAVSDYINIPLDKISYSSSSGYNCNTITSFITSLNSNGVIITFNSGLGSDIPLKIEHDGTYSVSCSLSIQQNNSNNYTSEFPPTVEVILGYYFNSIGKPITAIPSRMTLTSITNSTTGNTQYNYSSFVNTGYIFSGVGLVPSVKDAVLFAYVYQFEEVIPPPGPIVPPIPPTIIVNNGNGLYVNVIPNFIVTKLT